MEVVTDEDVVGAQPGDDLAMSLFEGRAAVAFPEAFFAVSAGGQRMEGAVVAELDVEVEERQKKPRKMATSRSAEAQGTSHTNLVAAQRIPAFLKPFRRQSINIRPALTPAAQTI